MSLNARKTDLAAHELCSHDLTLSISINSRQLPSARICLCPLIAYIANNMDKDQAAPLGHSVCYHMVRVI